MREMLKMMPARKYDADLKETYRTIFANCQKSSPLRNLYFESASFWKFSFGEDGYVGGSMGSLDWIQLRQMAHVILREHRERFCHCPLIEAPPASRLRKNRYPPPPECRDEEEEKLCVLNNIDHHRNHQLGHYAETTGQDYLQLRKRHPGKNPSASMWLVDLGGERKEYVEVDGMEATLYDGFRRRDKGKMSQLRIQSAVVYSGKFWERKRMGIIRRPIWETWRLLHTRRMHCPT